jgi:hypothetical protein
MLVLAAIYWVLLFGFVSRRFECHADLYSFESIANPSALPDALATLSILGGAPRRASSWRHFSVGKRIDLLHQVAARPETARALKTRIAVMKAALLALFVACVARLLVQRPELFGL